MIEKRLIGILVLTLLFVLPVVSGEIVFDSQEDIYNYGDNIEYSASIISEDESSGRFNIYLSCEDSEILFHSEHLSFGEKETVENEFKINEDSVEGMEGDCRFIGEYGDEEGKSEEFSISTNVDINLDKEEIEGKVGDSLIISGEAVKENGQKLDGFFELSFDGEEITGEVSRGSFSKNITIPTLESEEYSIDIRAYEREDGEVINEGEEEVSLEVKETPTSIKIDSNDSFLPGDDLVIEPTILDQINETISENLVLDVRREGSEEEVYREVVNSSEEISISIPERERPGYWTIEGEGEGLVNTKTVKIEEMEEASFDIFNGTLVINNTGNVNYDRPVEIGVGNETIVKSFDLSPGEEMELGLSAPEGEYQVLVKDGEKNITSNSYLTGGAIGVDEFSKGMSIFSKYPFVWLFLIGILGAFIFTLSYRTISKRSYSYPGGKQKSLKRFKRKSSKSKEVRNLKYRNIKEAEHSSVMDGNKENVSLMAFKCDDKNVREKAKETINDNKGVFYETDNYVFGIFSALTTKTFDNEERVLKVASKLSKELDSKEDIKYGLALNSGKLILKKGEKMKFSDINNTMGEARKLAKLSNNEVLLSESINKNLGREVRTSKKKSEEGNVYKIKDINNREKYKEFISGFLERNKEE